MCPALGHSRKRARSGADVVERVRVAGVEGRSSDSSEPECPRDLLRVAGAVDDMERSGMEGEKVNKEKVRVLDVFRTQSSLVGRADEKRATESNGQHPCEGGDRPVVKLRSSGGHIFSPEGCDRPPADVLRCCVCIHLCYTSATV